MNFQEENPADKEAEEKEVNASQRGSRGEENTLRASLEEHMGKGSPGWVRAVCSHPRHMGVLQASGLSTNCLTPNCSVGRGLSLLSESEGGREQRRLRSRCQTTLLGLK